MQAELWETSVKSGSLNEREAAEDAIGVREQLLLKAAHDLRAAKASRTDHHKHKYIRRAGGVAKERRRLVEYARSARTSYMRLDRKADAAAENTLDRYEDRVYHAARRLCKARAEAGDTELFASLAKL